MKICPKCGYATPDDSDEFCTKCGAYYTEAQKGQQGTSAMAAALGMMGPASRPQAVPVPEKGTLKAGLDDMEAGNYPEAMAQWTSMVRGAGQPSEEDYRSMVDSAVACILSTIGDGQLHSRAGTAELAMELDNDLLQDIMAGIIAEPEFDPVKAASASSEYMFLALESFSVYPDMRDVLEVIRRVPDDIGKLVSSSAPAEGTKPQAEMGIHSSYATMLAEIITEAIESAGPERMDELADYWSTKANLPYVNIVYNLSGLYAQVSMAKNVGRFTGKLLQKGINMQVDAFRKSYFDVRL